MDAIAVQPFETPFGELLLGAYRDRLCLCNWTRRKMRGRTNVRIQHGLQARYEEREDALLNTARSQLNEYFQGRRKAFELPLLLVGTAFQKSVWNALRQIPHGQTRSYAQLAQQIDNPAAVRAVGSANGANALSIIVPCHRVIGADGRLAGYAGGEDIKRQLLDLEQDLCP